MQPAVETLFQRLLLDASPESLTPAAVARAATACGFSAKEAADLAENAPRFRLYQRLVHGTLRSALELAIPRAIARLGDRFDVYFERFLRERGPASHYLRDVTTELLDFCAGPLGEDQEVPAYVLELARHEALRISVAAATETPPSAHPAPLTLDLGVQFIAASTVVRYAHAVHRLSEDETSLEAPQERPTALFVYRSPDDEVRYLELTPLAATILERLQLRGETLKAATLGACTDHGVTLDEGTLAGAAELLADLADRGALVGAREIA